MAAPLLTRWGRHALAIGVLLLPFLPIWWRGELLMSADAINYEVPCFAYLKSLWLTGCFEEWYPFSDGGMPLTGATAGRLFYPLQLWFLLGDPLRGLLGYFLLHSLLAYGGAYLYLRHLRLERTPAALGALAYAGSSARIHLAPNAVFHPILALAPAWLWLLERALERPGARTALPLSLLTTAVLSGGGWQLVLVIALHLLVWALASRPGRAAWAWLALAAGLAGLATAPTWMPLAEQGRQGILRSTAFDARWLAEGSLTQALDLGALYSPFYGSRTEQLRQKGANSHEFVAVAGIALAPLWLAGLRPRRQRRRWMLVWSAMLLADASLALGAVNPVTVWLHAHLPGLGGFRVPLRCLAAFPLWLMGAVAFGAEALGSRPRRELALLPVLYYGAYLLWGRSDWMAAHALLLASVLAATALALIPRLRPGALWLAVALQLMAPVLWVHSAIFMPPAALEAEQSLLADVATRLRPGESVHDTLNAEDTVLAGMRNAAAATALTLRRVADFLFWMEHGREASAEEYQRLLFQNWAPSALRQGARPDWPLNAMSRMLGIRFLISEGGVQELPAPLPGFWQSQRSRVAGREEAFELMSGRGFRPETEVLLNEPAAEEPPFTTGSPSWRSLRPSRLELQLNGASGWFSVPLPAYPGWTVELDGQPLPIVRSYNLFQSVAVPPGGRTLVWSYRSAPFRTGLLALGVALLGWGALGFSLVRSRSASSPSSESR